MTWSSKYPCNQCEHEAGSLYLSSSPCYLSSLTQVMREHCKMWRAAAAHRVLLSPPSHWRGVWPGQPWWTRRGETAGHPAVLASGTGRIQQANIRAPAVASSGAYS